jgi:hypothetical protein
MNAPGVTPPHWLSGPGPVTSFPVGGGGQSGGSAPQQAQQTLENLQLPGGILPIYFGHSNLPGTTTDTELYRIVPGSSVVASQIGLTVPFNGSIVAVVVDSSEAKTAGTAVFTSRAAATNALAVTWSEGTSAYAVANASTYPVLAGQEVDIRVTTVGFTPTTADVAVTVLVAQSV